MRHLRNSAFPLLLLLSAHLALAIDASSLKPPPGARVAVVMFEDLQCSDCARAYPLIWEAANAHHVPVVLHDFPLNKHAWAFQAALYARFFDTKSEKLGNDFRGYIYANQPQITPANLLQFVQRFADQNKVPLPFAIDPEGKLKEKVQADYELGQRIGVTHTPTIVVVSNSSASTPFVEVVDRAQLNEIIEEMQRQSAPPTPAPSQRTHRKKPG